MKEEMIYPELRYLEKENKATKGENKMKTSSNDDTIIAVILMYISLWLLGIVTKKESNLM